MKGESKLQRGDECERVVQEGEGEGRKDISEREANKGREESREGFSERPEDEGRRQGKGNNRKRGYCRNVAKRERVKEGIEDTEVECEGGETRQQ